LDRNSGKDRLLDGRQTFLGAGDLDEQVGPSGPRGKFLGGGDGAGPCHAPAVATPPAKPTRPPVCAVMNRPEQIGGPHEIIQRQIEEKELRQLSPSPAPRGLPVVRGTVLDGGDRRSLDLRSVGHRQFVNVAFESAAIQQIGA